MMTAEDVVKRIATECAFIDERGGVGIRLKPAAALVREYGEQFEAAPTLRLSSSPPRRVSRRRRREREPTLF